MIVKDFFRYNQVRLSRKHYFHMKCAFFFPKKKITEKLPLLK